MSGRQKMLEMARRIREEQLCVTQVTALLLACEEGGVRLKDVVRRACVTHPTGTQTADRLEALGLARREPVEGDRRAWKLVATAAGMRCAERLGEGWNTEG